MGEEDARRGRGGDRFDQSDALLDDGLKTFISYGGYPSLRVTTHAKR